MINWFPGHINAATASLLSSLRQCDVILEVRDVRAPFATTHPELSLWCGGRPRIICLNKSDLVPPLVRRMWLDAVKAGKAQELFSEQDAPRAKEAAGRTFATKGKDKGRDAEVQRQRDIARMRNEAAQREAFRQGGPGGGGGGGGGGSGGDPSDAVVALAQTGVVDATLLTDGLENAGPQLKALLAEIHRSGASVNARRADKGLLPRPLRVGVVGYPNVGKSALINRVLGRKRAKSADTPGVTRQLTWVRVSAGSGGGDAAGSSSSASAQRRHFEMLDSPGLLPQNLVDQHAASLAACVNAIGVGGYDAAVIAGSLFDTLRSLDTLIVQDGRYGKMGKSTVLQVACPDYVETALTKYSVDVLSDKAGGGDEILRQVAESVCHGDVDVAAVRVLNDFRSGRMGKVCLQVPRTVYDDEGKAGQRGGDGAAQTAGGGTSAEREAAEAEESEDEERIKRREDEVTRIASETGVILPPKKPEAAQTNATRIPRSRSDLKKGRFDGW
jgi:ribosome biogenesis GTPase A